MTNANATTFAESGIDGPPTLKMRSRHAPITPPAPHDHDTEPSPSSAPISATAELLDDLCNLALDMSEMSECPLNEMDRDLIARARERAEMLCQRKK